MRKLVIGMIDNRGFTLIEIMIVLVIIGITFGFALIAFGDFGESRRLLFSIEQLVNSLRVAQQQAILETSTFGLQIDNTRFQILQFQSNTAWKPVSNKGIFKVNYFPKNTVIFLKTNNNYKPGTPPVIINSSGDMTPFTISFTNNKAQSIAVLSGSHNGDLNLKETSNK